MPQIGTITDYHQPTGNHIRVDSALCAGYEVGLYYDPLSAKVMAWGETREDSIKCLLRALLSFRAEGPTCNTSLLRDVLASTEFAESTHHTGSMATWLEARKIRAHHQSVTRAKMKNGNGKSGRETAAAIAVAMALASKNAFGAPIQPANQWRAYGRREQLQSRSLISRSRR